MSCGPLIRGSSVSIPVELPEGAFDTLVGATAFFTVKPVDAVLDDDDQDSAAIIKKDIELTTEDLTITFNLTPSDMNVTPGEYAWGVQIQTASGQITEVCLSPDKVKIEPDITRRSV